MSISRILESSPEEVTKLDDATITELSNLTPEEAVQLSNAWLDWPADTVIDLLERLTQFTLETLQLEFETVFRHALEHGDARVRRLGLAGLAESTDRVVALKMAKIVRDDPDPIVRASAAANLAVGCRLAAEGSLIERDARRVFDSLSGAFEDVREPLEVRRRALESIAAFGGERVNQFLRVAYADDALEMRQSAIVAMGRTNDPSFIDFVVINLDHINTEMRLEAVNALGELCDEDQVDLLEGPLDDQDLEVQLTAVSALERIGGPDAKRLLQRAARSPEPRVAAAAKQAIRTVDEVENLDQPITPAMAKRGMYGAPVRLGPELSDEEYDAASREGWGHLGEEGEDTGGEGRRLEEEDPFDSIIEFERPPDQADIDD